MGRVNFVDIALISLAVVIMPTPAYVKAAVVVSIIAMH